jgi:hypothetical protein
MVRATIPLSFRGQNSMRRKKRKYSVLSLENGIVKIKKPCGYCEKKHTVQFPVDDMFVKRRMNSLCNYCEQQLEEIRKKYPNILKRKRQSDT